MEVNLLGYQYDPNPWCVLERFAPFYIVGNEFRQTIKIGYSLLAHERKEVFLFNNFQH